jgi:hypothetical protein
VSKGYGRADARIRNDGVGDADIARIDGILAVWRQGDVVLQEEGFVHLADLACPLTEEADAAQTAVGSGMDDPSIAGIYTAVPGVVVLTQTCDIVRSCCKRPFVEVAPLVQVDEAGLRETRKALVVNRAYVPGVADRRLVADLDRVMTVEKAVLVRWPRTPGCSTDAETRAFGEALGRKRARPAFPDDFVAALARLQRRIRDKHGRSSIEGQLLEALREIRIHASPSWDATQVLVRFLFIKDSDPEGLEGRWARQVEGWLDLVDRNGRFIIADPEVGRLEDFSARDFVESDRLDLDWLSAGR